MPKMKIVNTGDHLLSVHDGKGVVTEIPAGEYRQFDSDDSAVETLEFYVPEHVIPVAPAAPADAPAAPADAPAAPAEAPAANENLEASEGQPVT